MIPTSRLAAALTVLMIIFLHYWGTGPADKLATGFKAAVNELGRHGAASTR